MKLRERRTRWSVLAAMLLGAVTLGHAYDEDHAQAHLQPFFGVYVGGYQSNTDDLNNLLPNKKNDFLPIMPNGGLTLGAAYDRFHAGVSIGYQLPNSNDLSAAEQASNSFSYATVEYADQSASGAFPACADTTKPCRILTSEQRAALKDFSYDMIPIEAFVDMTVFKNSAAVNFLFGGSAGVGLVSLTQPISAYVYQVGDTVKSFVGTGGKNGPDKQSLFLYSAYIGMRINIAERLNLQGQVGWRGAFTDRIYFADCDCYEYATNVQNAELDPATNEIKSLSYVNQRQYRLDLSGAFLRADLRWTFASQSDKDADRTAVRRQALEDARVASAYRLR